MFPVTLPRDLIQAELGSGPFGKDQTMKRSQFTEEQIIGGARTGIEDGGYLPQTRDQRGDILQLEEQVWRDGGVGGNTAELQTTAPVETISFRSRGRIRCMRRWPLSSRRLLRPYWRPWALADVPPLAGPDDSGKTVAPDPSPCNEEERQAPIAIFRLKAIPVVHPAVDPPSLRLMMR